MLARLEMKLSEYENMSYQMASSFHGALMELISPDYADELHLSRLHPYTQHLEHRSDGWYWVVTTLNDKAYEELIKKTLLEENTIFLNKKEVNLSIIDKKSSVITDKELASSFYNDKADRYQTLQFVTPAAFKIDGRYVNIPNIRSVYSSLMNKYDAVSADDSMRDEDSLEQLVSSTLISRYELKSTGFSLEGVKIPSFIGKMTFKINGTRTMCNFADMLFRFGEFSGLGIKTSLGMGALRLIH